MPIEFRGPHLDFLHTTYDPSVHERDLEGSLSCGKTTVALWSELEALKRWPGIWTLICRWTDEATRTLLRPAFEQLARVHGTVLAWNDKLSYYDLENGARVFAFGLKTASQKPEERYGKIRGLPVSRIYVDQAEQLPADIADELRFRLRPDIEAQMRQQAYPTQITFTPNPPNDDHWLAKQFPVKNNIKGRRYWALSLFDNAHNLPPSMIESAERTYPREHPKFRTVIMGQRGLNVMGDPVYENLFDRQLHVRAIKQHEGELLEAIECGQHNPVWLVAQRTRFGGVELLGGVLGKHLVLEDFLPVVQRHRREWFPDAEFKSCTSPMGETKKTQGSRVTLIQRIKAAGFPVVWRANANAADVRLAMIEELSALLRRRVMSREEAFGIHNDSERWLSLSIDGTVKQIPFAAYAFEGGYVWSEHTVSVGSKDVRQPHEDDEYANVMHAIENIVLNFCIAQKTADELAKDEAKQRKEQAEALVGVTAGEHDWMRY